jgi:cytochrome c biogenesis protein CcmG/thiol:disulfide interchange protein DsbE
VEQEYYKTGMAMTKKEQVLTGLALIFAMTVLYLFVAPSCRMCEASPAGRKAPNFALEENGHQMHLADFRGKVVLLDFWASWCEPCVEEAPSLNALQYRIEPKGGVVLGISQDYETSAYQRFLSVQRVSFPTFLDATSTSPGLGKVAYSYGTVQLPEAYVISRDGLIALKVVGPQNWMRPDLTSAIDRVLQSN